MEFREVLRRRRMVRNYAPDRPVPPLLRERILAHALRAPSAGFAQGWAFLVLEERLDRDRFWAAATPATGGRERWLESMRTAPLIIVPHADPSAYLDAGTGRTDETRGAVPYWFVDTGFASLLMLLTVVDEGLGACFFGIPPTRTAAYRTEFGVPDEFVPVGAVAIGYRAPDHRSGSLRRGRRPESEVVHRGQWH
jgi:nitroreductase